MQAVVKKVVYSFRYRLGPGQVGREVFHIVSMTKIGMILLATSTAISENILSCIGESDMSHSHLWNVLPSTQVTARTSLNDCTGFEEQN